MIKLNFTTPFLKPRDIKGMTSAPYRQRQAELMGHYSTAPLPASSEHCSNAAPGVCQCIPVAVVLKALRATSATSHAALHTARRAEPPAMSTSPAR